MTSESISSDSSIEPDTDQRFSEKFPADDICPASVKKRDQSSNRDRQRLENTVLTVRADVHRTPPQSVDVG